MAAAFKEVLDALYDLLDAQTAFKSKVGKNDFSKIYDTGDSCLILRPSSFTSADDAFGGVYAVVWDIMAEIHEPSQRITRNSDYSRVNRGRLF